MIHGRKRNVMGVLVDVIDYEAAVEFIIQAAKAKQPYAVTALAVHGLMTGTLNAEQRYRLNSLDLAVPDGQPIRWALNGLFGVGLRDRVCGPELTLAVCARAEKENLPVYFYGGTAEILARLKQNLQSKFPKLQIAGTEPSKFRRTSPEEKDQLIQRIRGSSAAIVFVGLGCPRQEIWAFEYRDSLPVPVLAVGAAFPFLAGTVPRAPEWMQRWGLEWFFRLCAEPLRLWKRYLLLNPLFLLLLLLQKLRVARFEDIGKVPPEELLYG